MSAELWARDGSGINRKFRELWAQDGTGVNRKQKELWANDGTGVNRKIFSGAVKWTYTVSLITNETYNSLASYGNNATDSVFSIINTYSGQASRTVVVDVIYTFSDPIVFHAGDTIVADLITSGSLDEAGIWAFTNDNTSPVLASYGGAAFQTTSYTFPADTTVSKIRVSNKNQPQVGESTYSHADVTINTNGKQFLLNNSGSSDQ